MALLRIKVYEKNGLASTFYEKLFKLLYLMLSVFFLFTRCYYVLRYKSECRIKYFFSLILTFNVGSIIKKRFVIWYLQVQSARRRKNNLTRNMLQKLVSWNYFSYANSCLIRQGTRESSIEKNFRNPAWTCSNLHNADNMQTRKWK